MTGDQIQITVYYDPATGLAKWYLRSYAASTIDHFPTNAYAGFLPPNNEEGDGQGYVSFVVKLDANLTTGDIVETNATIVFDVNEAITTNTWLKTIDADAPTVALVSVGANDEPGTATLVCESSDVGSGVASYDVYYSVDGGAVFTKWNSTSESTITFEAPVAGDYVFYVVALDGVGNAAASDISTSVSLSAYVGEALIAPGEITFGVYDKTMQSVSVSWIDASSDEDKFRVEISSDGENWTLVGTPEADSTSTTINVPGAGNYTMRVCAVNSNGASDWTTAELALILSEASEGITFGEYDAASRSVSMSWTDNSDDETGFRVEYSKDGGETWLFAEALEADSTYRVAWGVRSNLTYDFRVCAVRGTERSKWAYSTTTLNTHATSVANASFDVPCSGDYTLTLPVAVQLVEQKAVRVASIQDAFEDAAFLQFESDVDFTPELAGEAGESELFVDLFNDDLLEVRF